MYVLYYVSMLRCWYLIWILVRTDHPCLGVGCHNMTLGAIRGWPIHYPGIHHCRRGEVSSNSVTVEATKFAGPYKSRMHQYIIKLAHQGQTIGP
jgi:hypothetical protein